MKRKFREVGMPGVETHLISDRFAFHRPTRWPRQAKGVPDRVLNKTRVCHGPSGTLEISRDFKYY